jgi:hypothetical protein
MNPKVLLFTHLQVTQATAQYPSLKQCDNSPGKSDKNFLVEALITKRLTKLREQQREKQREQQKRKEHLTNGIRKGKRTRQRDQT